MKTVVFIFFTSILFIACNWTENEPKQTRIERSFNQGWLILFDSLNQGEAWKWYVPGRIPSDTLRVNIPHTWNVMGGKETYIGIGWYFKYFNLPGAWEGKLIRLKFNAVYRDAKIWVNEKLITERIGAGYTPFEIDLSDHVFFDKENFIAVQVSNAFSKQAIPYEKKFDWAADGGIIRGVKLTKTERPAIAFLHVNANLKEIQGGELTIKVGLAGHENLDIGDLDVWMQVRQYNQPTEDILYEGNQKSKILADHLILRLDLKEVDPWHFNVPNLYKLKLAIGHRMMLSDHKEAIFGFRSFTTQGDRILFNGEMVRLPGIEWMPGSFPDQGMAEDTLSMGTMLMLLKNTNAVLTRFHWQQDDYILKWCDENGILVQEEIPLWQAPYPDQVNPDLKDIASRHIQEMIREHYNHPSVIAWGIGNELSAQNDTIKNLLKELRNRIISLDSSRLINYVSNTFHNDPERDGTALGDILMWNDYSGLWYDLSENGLTSRMLPETLSKFNKAISGKSLIISEYGLCEPVFKGGDPKRIEHFLYNTGIYDKNEFIGGVIYFSLNDYRTHMGEEGSGRLKRRVHGIVDIQGNLKPSFSIIKERFSPVKDLDGKLIHDNFHVTGKNQDGLPSYTLYKYQVNIYGENERLIAREPIPDLRPGERFNVVFRRLIEPVKMIRIVTGNGFTVSTKHY